jgi:hypothetical protein
MSEVMARNVLVAILLATIGATPAAWASTASLSPDITVTLDGVDFADESVAIDDALGTTLPISLGTLPGSAAVTAYHLLGNGDQLFALDTTAELAGPLTVYPSDVVRYDGVSYSLEFDSTAAAIPAGVAVDAVSRTAGGDLLLSFDTTVDLGAVIASDEDLVEWNGASFTMVFDVDRAFKRSFRDVR